MNEENKICKLCIMPEHLPEIYLNNEGICNLCVAHETAKKFDIQKPLESDLIKILNKYKGKQKYDCMVMCSGGKDSTSSLYYMKKRYGLNVLAFTFDHGFETDEALENIKNAVEILKVDFMLFSSSFMQDMFAKIVSTNSKAVICHPCSIWYMDLAFDVAARYEIPIIVAGWTKGQSTRQEVMSKCGCNVHAAEFKQMADNTKFFLENELKDMPQYKNFPRTMEEVLARSKKRFKSIVISPHWFLPYSTEEYVKVIKDELKWKAPVFSYPAGSTNCSLNFMSVYYSMKHYGYTHYHVEASKMIREGLLLREEALKQLELNFDEKTLKMIAGKLGVNNFETI
ncbi:MAG TPA: 7-cyano-7-deazaguanine synthase [Bacteroidales bacterium]|nr:7-cyano-7-deazaguanine synthase [Bacteroidales bacterium]